MAIRDTLFAPAASGIFTISGLDGQATATSVSVSATVGDDGATAAVEALATEVATLMAALKAQITTLANTVAKIAKKVKA